MDKVKIGYTTGVFDMFHIGHLNILKSAKEHCEYLIVGISTDELCQAYKGKIPVIPFTERKAIVESIRYVDKVVPQYDRDKFKAWKELQFNVLFVGDDWKGTTFFNELEKKFNNIGVGIKYFPHTKGISSSILKDRFLKYEK